MRRDGAAAGRRIVYRGTFDVPVGNHEYKVALNGSWNENYGAGGAPGGANIPLDAPGGPLTFTYDHATHVISDNAPVKLGRERAAHWVRAGLIAWNLPDQRAGFSYRLHAAPEGGLAIEDGQIAGGTSFPLTLNESGLPAGVRAAYPHLAAHEALELSSDARRRPAAAHRAAASWPPTTRRARSSGDRRADPGRARRPLRRPRTTPTSVRPGATAVRAWRCGRRRPST